MKPIFLGLFAGLLSFTAFASEADPRVLEILRNEQSVAQSFCFSFVRGGVRNGMTVADTCLRFASGRYAGNFEIAKKTKDLASVGETISREQGAFCAAVGEFTQPGGWTKADCDAWNRQRAELFTLGTTAGTPTATLSAKIEKVEGTRRRFCQSLLQSGAADDASTFSTRISQCFSLVKLSTASDRALFLGAF